MNSPNNRGIPTKRTTLLFFFLAVVLLCAALGLVETQTHVVHRFLDNVSYDNRNHYLECEELPTLEQVERVLEEQGSLIAEIEQTNPGNVGVEIGAACLGKADLIFWYGGHQDRLKIEALIGAETFFGIPYRLQNR